MFTTAVVVAGINTFVYGTLLTRVSDNALKIAAGYSFWVDLIFTGLIGAMAVATGSLTGLMISAVTGLFISLALYGVKWYHGSATYKRVKVEGKRFKQVMLVEQGPTGLPACLKFIETPVKGIMNFVTKIRGNRTTMKTVV